MDPELEAFVPFFPKAELTDVVAERAVLAGLAAGIPAETDGMEVEDLLVPGTPPVPVRVYRPHEARGTVVWMHGGGWCIGDVETEHPWASRVAARSGCAVISVGYRLAPENPFPAALDDAWTVLRWAHENAADPDLVAVAGHSAGGGLAAALALRARDEQGPPIRFQLLHQPGLDDRLTTWSARHFTETPWYNRAKAAQAWAHYLGGRPATPYAAPSRAEDLSDLPPAYVATAELCPSRDEGIAYAVRLMQSDVRVELHQFPGTFHGSQALLSAAVSQRQFAEIGDVLRRALA
ncbi:alpha/beta hydrolase [Lentzea sp.]|uniref:alpha/beta hydrolase n=1 Tax=Lentzea sp. TaxID=56099 RepID=UPI002CF6D269|nr:alpha/beta hydrolase [Lentzea sp.]HUQ58899.1 alpha/beta hydrolase [Lentzea sp.]